MGEHCRLVEYDGAETDVEIRGDDSVCDEFMAGAFRQAFAAL